MHDNELLEFIENWFSSKCNGDWEHSDGIKIETIDNPGWRIKIDLNNSDLKTIKYSSGLIESNENNWYSIKIEDGIFEAYGDPTKLKFLLHQFSEFVLQQRK